MSSAQTLTRDAAHLGARKTKANRQRVVVTFIGRQLQIGIIAYLMSEPCNYWRDLGIGFHNYGGYRGDEGYQKEGEQHLTLVIHDFTYASMISPMTV
jgi:hypothetical protein